MTDAGMIKRYPWYSVDATTASSAGRMGTLMTPWGRVTVSKTSKTYRNPPVFTAKKIEVVMNWIDSMAPGVIQEWNEIAVGTPLASAKRTVINALYLEQIMKRTK
jgi:predicted outer membrane lipoprotein